MTFTPTPHPVLKLPTREQGLAMGAEKLREFLIKREELILLEKEDPYRGGFYLDTWKEADEQLKDSLLLALFGGNGSAKTFYMCRKAMETALEKPGAKVLLLHEAANPSILLHHATVYHYLPKELKVPNTKRSRVTKINYSVGNGFTDAKLVLPNGSIIVFGAYKQDLGDYEGTGWALICADENLPLGWLKTLMYRLPRCGGKMLWGFTPIKGITPAVKHVVQGAVTLQSRKAELLPQNLVHVPDCPAGHMPYIQRAVWPATKIMYFPSELNPFGGYEDFKKILQGRTKTEIEQRAYGYARNTVGSCFPKFSAIHILKREQVAEFLKGNPTRRHYADPAGARNMFQIWGATDEHERMLVYREWPDMPTYGEWAVTAEDSRKWDGDPGPAQPTLAYGTIEYKRIILEAEGWKWTESGWVETKEKDISALEKALHAMEHTGQLMEEDVPKTRVTEKIFERKFDPRSGKAGAMTEEHGGVSLMDMFLEENVDELGRIVGPALDFTQAKGLTEDQGIMRINDLLSFNEKQPLCAFLNEPKLYISEDCPQLIWALQTYTRHDGEKAACKDPIDCLRYFVTDDAEYVSEANMQCRGGGSY